MDSLKWWLLILLTVVVFSLTRERGDLKDSALAETKGEVSDTLTVQQEQPEEKQVPEEERILEAALGYFAKVKDKSGLPAEWMFLFKEDDLEAEVDAGYGALFSPTHQHLSLAFSSKGKEHRYLFLVQEGEILAVDAIVQTDDFTESKEDINGDGLPDLLRRYKDGTAKLKIFDSGNGQFAEALTLTNVCLSPSERLVRGFRLSGGDTVFYKQVWEGTHLLVKEVIHRHPDNANWRLKVADFEIVPSIDNAQVLWYLPKEYRTVAECAQRQSGIEMSGSEKPSLP